MPETTTDAGPALLLTVPQFAQRMGVSVRTAWQIVGDGEVESVLVRRCRRVPADAADRYVADLRAAS